MSISLSNLATLYMSKGEPQKALVYAKNALCLIEPHVLAMVTQDRSTQAREKAFSG
jgi:hypothetical protein